MKKREFSLFLFLWGASMVTSGLVIILVVPLGYCIGTPVCIGGLLMMFFESMVARINNKEDK